MNYRKQLNRFDLNSLEDNMFQQKRTTIHTIPSFKMGLNTQTSPEELDDLEMADCENFSVEEDSIITSPGLVLWDNSGTTTTESYPETNQSSEWSMSIDGNPYAAQSFTMSASGTLQTAKMYMKKTGSPTGTMTLSIYAHTGVYGSSGKPTGSPLATSAAIDISTLTTSFALNTFTFSGTGAINITSGVNYELVLFTNGGDSTLGDEIVIGYDSTSSSYAGNRSYSADGVVWNTASNDYCFYVTVGTTQATGPYWGGFAFKNSASVQKTIRQRQDKLEYSTDGAQTWTLCTLPTTGSPAVAISLAQVQPSFAVLNDILLYSNGTDSVLSTTDGITWVTQSTLPKSRVVFNNGQNRIIFASQPSSPYRIDWSAINDPLTVSASSYQLIDPNSNGYIVGMGITPQGTNVVVKQSGAYSISSYLVDGAVDVNFIGSTTCANHHTICTTENSVIWTGIGGIYEYSDSIRRIDGHISWNGRNMVLRSDLFTAAYFNGKYHLSIPDSTISTTYNSQEYIIYKHIQRGDPLQPYAITRNKRYFGCYIIEDFINSLSRTIKLYAGESRGTISGVNYTNFGYINDFRDESVSQGIAGVTQPAFIVSKYFTDNVPYYVKRFKKIFSNVKVTQDVTVVFSYRFLPYGSWIDTPVTFTSGSLDFVFGDSSTGGFSEGYSFYIESSGETFIDIENAEKPRGIQFKIATNSINDVKIFSLSYNFIVKPKFKN